MKRMTLHLDLDDNQILEEEIEQLIRARVKQLTREACEQQINEEFERITKQKIESLKNPWSTLSHNFSKRVSDALEDRLVEMVEREFNLRTMISTKLQVMMNNGINEMLGNMVDEAVRKHLRGMLSGALK